MESVEVIGAAWAMRVASEMGMDCMALLGDVHNNKEQTFIPKMSIERSLIPVAIATEDWRLPL